MLSSDKTGNGAANYSAYYILAIPARFRELQVLKDSKKSTH